jgi:hypothetical protein
MASKPINTTPPPEMRLLRIQLGPEHGTTWVSTPTTTVPPATIEPAPASHSGVARRPSVSRTQQPATNITGPAKAHSIPQNEYPAPIADHSRKVE